MGKRSNFERVPHDNYDTPRGAVLPLLPYLAPATEFAEPCAGRGFLIDHLVAEGHRCVWATDVAPRREDIGCLNVLALPRLGLRNIRAKMFITNPPWTRSILHPIIDRLSSMLPCWFLFDADWAHTRMSSELILRCATIVPIGRVKWIPGSKYTGKDNSCWYQFVPGHTTGPQLMPRAARVPRAQYHAMMGPEERRRAEIKAFGAIAGPGPLFEIGRSDGQEETRAVPLVPTGAGVLEQQREARPAASDLGPRNPRVPRGNGHGQELPPLQQDQGRDAAGGVGGVSTSASGLLAKLRRGLRPMVLPRITPGDVDQ